MYVTYPDARAVFALCYLIAFDSVWFTAAKKLYPPLLSVLLPYAFVAWCILACAIGMLRPTTSGDAAIAGATLGFIVYSVFNATEAAIRPDWRQAKTILGDTLWGTFVCAAVTLICLETERHTRVRRGSIVLAASVALLVVMHATGVFQGVHSRLRRVFKR